MTKRKQSRTQTDKVVAVQVGRKTIDGKPLFFLFTARQIEEVLADVHLTPAPFAPAFLSGVCSWRGHVAPVIDIEQRFGFTGSSTGSRDRFIVVRAGAPGEAEGEKMLRCVLRVTDQIQTLDATAASAPISADRLGVESSLIMGAFQQEEDFFIVPDLAAILGAES